ncbi:hypothetical protein AG1IA_07751 [Rhizoctonia solani AG-1 IA]|uniref:Uncharacterized protein n=1 Tax=Thanatephorus cucumeris (strain AG1-IA) TaxID=983506 RepID=L8WN83_THACA|nr:hypothetical protein AG1IA_07751 [Rhizoctonia solani AG-1 IA]
MSRPTSHSQSERKESQVIDRECAHGTADDSPVNIPDDCNGRHHMHDITFFESRINYCMTTEWIRGLRMYYMQCIANPPHQDT